MNSFLSARNLAYSFIYKKLLFRMAAEMKIVINFYPMSVYHHLLKACLLKVDHKGKLNLSGAIPEIVDG